MSDQEQRSSVIDPYNTTLGRLIDTRAIKKELMIYISKLSDKTSCTYGLTFNNILPIVLVGKEEESSIPAIPYPMFAKDNINREYIVIDLREFASKEKARKITGNTYGDLVNTMTKQENMFFQLRCARVMDVCQNGLGGRFPDLYDQLLNTYVGVFYRMLNRIGDFPAQSYMDFKMAIGVFFYMLMSPVRLTEVHDPKGEFKLLAKKLELPNHLISDFENGVVGSMTILAHNVLEENYRLLRTFFMIFEEKVFTGCGYENLVKEELFYQRNNNLWYGIGTKSAPLIGLENIPVFVALIETATIVSSFKRTLFSNMIKDIKGVKINTLVENIQRKFSFQ